MQSSHLKHIFTNKERYSFWFDGGRKLGDSPKRLWVLSEPDVSLLRQQTLSPYRHRAGDIGGQGTLDTVQNRN